MVDKNSLLGAWTLLSWSIAYSNDKAPTHPFGEMPQGLIVYTHDDWMSACISHAPRAALPADVPFRRVDPALLAASYLSYFHYAGRFAVHEGVVTHTVTQSLNPNFVGTRQRRVATLSDSRLTLSGEEVVDGVTRFHTLEWQRAANA